jgi:hypothetical protein
VVIRGSGGEKSVGVKVTLPKLSFSNFMSNDCAMIDPLKNGLWSKKFLGKDQKTKTEYCHDNREFYSKKKKERKVLEFPFFFFCGMQ